MQEQIEREAIAVTLRASRLTARVLAKALAAVVRKIQKKHHKAQTQQGRQSIRNLMNHNVPTNTIPIEGDKNLFEQVARKWHVDYAFHKTGQHKYLLLFKSGQADAITAAFSEYSAKVMKRAKDKRQPIREQHDRAAEHVEREKPKYKERKRERGAVLE